MDKDEILLTPREYVQRQGQCCPYCKGIQLVWSRIFREDETKPLLYRKCTCGVCGKHWEEIFRLVTYHT
jgi:hypothetical protein